MNQNIQLKIKKLPNALAELTHSNQFMKMAALCSFGICFLLGALCFYLAAKPPVVFSFAPDASVYQNSEMPNAENEVTKAIEAYIEKRYNWNPKTIKNQLDEAGAFIEPSTKQNYSAAMENVLRFSVEKNVSQRAYPNKIKIDLKKKTAFIFGDRITEIQGLKAAGDLSLELAFGFGPRTGSNPWGIYVVKEKEFAQ
jgi:hypothetical protein